MSPRAVLRPCAASLRGPCGALALLAAVLATSPSCRSELQADAKAKAKVESTRTRVTPGPNGGAAATSSGGGVPGALTLEGLDAGKILGEAPTVVVSGPGVVAYRAMVWIGRLPDEERVLR